MTRFREFQINQLFHIETDGDVIISNTKEGPYPLISHQHDNNGITKYINKLEDKKLYNYKETLALADRGVFYATTQCEDFYIGTRVKALTFIDGEKSEKVRLYFITAINKLQKLFSEYLYNATDKLPYLKIKLPVDEKDNIDYKYMESFIDNIKNQMIKKVEDESKKMISNYIKISKIDNNKIENYNNDYFKLLKKNCKEVDAGDYFEVISNPQLNKDSFKFSDTAEYPYFTRTVLNNGIAGYVEYLDNEHLIKGNCIAVGMMGHKFFYMKHDYYAGQFTKTLRPKFNVFDEEIALYFIAQFNKNTRVYHRVLVRDFEKELYKTKLIIPFNGQEIDYDAIRQFMKIEMKKTIKSIENGYLEKVKNIKICFE